MRNLLQRRTSSLHYQTFPTTPPATSGPPPTDCLSSPLSDTCSQNADNSSSKTRDSGAKQDNSTPVPVKQLAVLAIISLAEQTALNSFSPYLPEMTSTFPDVDKKKVGLFVGIIASSFAAAQFGTNLFLGRLSDKIGRKPVILTGTLLTALCFLAFGFCRTLFQAVTVQVVMGLINGNAGIVSTVLGEITDKSNQSSAFTYLPVVYGIGGITGPLIGGVLVHSARTGLFSEFPYLLPNLVAAILLLLEFLVCVFLLEESLKEAQSLPPLGKRVKNLFVWLWQFTAGARPQYLRTLLSPNNRDLISRGEEGDDYFGGEATTSALFPDISTTPSYRSILTPEITILLATFSIFNLSNISYNSLYPIFVSSEPPTGRGLFPKEIGLSLAFVGAISIGFQLLWFGPLQERLGNHWGYRLGLLGFTVAFWAMPFVGYYNSQDPSSKFWLWAELGGVLLLKTLSTVIGLTCAMLLLTNGTPNPSALGTINGLAQTLSAGGRAIGPLISGGLFTAATTVPKGEFLAWGVFGGISGLGFILSIISVKGKALETLDEEGEDGGEEGENESSRLLRNHRGHGRRREL